MKGTRTHNEMAQIVFRIPEVAQLLGCTELAARRMIDRGLIPARKFGRRVFVLAEDLEELLRALPPRERRGNSAQ